MSLCYREQRQLRSIEADLLQSDSHLTAMLYVFDRLYSGQDMPASEQVPSGQDRDRRAVTWIAVAFAVAALAISILFRAALTLPAGTARPHPATGRPARAHPAQPGSPRPAEPCRTGSPAGFTRIARWPLILPAPRLAAEFSERRGSPSSWSFAEHPPGSPMRGKQANGARRDPQPQRYRISVRGRLGQTMCAAFPVLQARTDGDQTVLTGMLADQAALYGVLAEIEALGLELLEVRRLPPR
jgi:hypothetical protein